MRQVYPALHMGGGPRLPQRVRDAAQSATALQHRADDDSRCHPPEAKTGASLCRCAGALSPVWWKKAAKDMPATFNARAETVAEKPMFRDAFKEPALHHPRERVLRMDGREGREAAASVHGGRRLAGSGLRRSLGSLARSGDEGRNSLMHHHRVRREQMDGKLS